MKLIHYYDKATKLYTEDGFIEPDEQKDAAAAPTYTIPANATDLQPVGFHHPKWNGTKWVEGNPKAKAALEKEHADEAKKEAEHEKDREDMIKDSDTSTKGLIKRIERLERIVERLSYVPPVAAPRP